MPDAEWVEQQARNFTMHLDETGVECSYLLRDRDGKFTAKFDAIITDDAGVTPKRPHQGLDNRTPIPPIGTPPASGESTNAICESKLGGVLKYYKRAA